LLHKYKIILDTPFSYECCLVQGHQLIELRPKPICQKFRENLDKTVD
jgi:hypothetical protein